MSKPINRTIIIHKDPAMRQGNVQFVWKIVNSLPDDQMYEVTISEHKGSKTLAQLGALFGLWFDYLSEQLGVGINDLHREMKEKYLAGIYANSQEGKQGYLQKMWVNELARIGENLNSSDPETALNAEQELVTHMKHLSLSWASTAQMREYMEKIQWHYASNGYHLPIPDKFMKAYQQEIERG